MNKSIDSMNKSIDSMNKLIDSMNKSINSMNKSIESMNINRPNQICLLLTLNGSFETNGLPYVISVKSLLYVINAVIKKNAVSVKKNAIFCKRSLKYPA